MRNGLNFYEAMSRSLEWKGYWRESYKAAEIALSVNIRATIFDFCEGNCVYRELTERTIKHNVSDLRRRSNIFYLCLAKLWKTSSIFWRGQSPKSCMLYECTATPIIYTISEFVSKGTGVQTSANCVTVTSISFKLKFPSGKFVQLINFVNAENSDRKSETSRYKAVVC